MSNKLKTLWEQHIAIVNAINVGALHEDKETHSFVALTDAYAEEYGVHYDEDCIDDNFMEMTDAFHEIEEMMREETA